MLWGPSPIAAYSLNICCASRLTNCSLHKGTFPNRVLPLCYLHLVYASCSYSSAQDGLDSQQLALVVFSCYQKAHRLHCACSVHYLQIALVVFFLYKTRHLLLCTLVLSSHVHLLMGDLLWLQGLSCRFSVPLLLIPLETHT